MGNPANESGENWTDLKNRVGGLLVSEFLKRYPDAVPVVYNHFGESCFECPAASEESLDLAIRAHETDEEDFYRDLAPHVLP